MRVLPVDPMVSFRTDGRTDGVIHTMSPSAGSNGNDSLSSYCLLGGLDALTAAFVVPINLLISVIAVAGNLLVIISVARFSVLRTPTNHFVVALASADLAVGLNIPFYISFYFDVPYVCHIVACQVKTFVAMWTTLCSFMLMIGVALDRYVSIVHPLTYPSLVTAKVSITAILCVCLYVTVLLILPYSLWPEAFKDLSRMYECDLVYVSKVGYAILFCAHLFLSLAATVLLYAFIFREAWRQNRQHLRREAKTAIMMVLIFGASIFSTLPYLVVVTVRYVAEDRIDQTALSQAKKMVLVFFFSKSAINPFIYGWKNRDFRFAFVRLLSCFPCAESFAIHDTASTVADDALHTEINGVFRSKTEMPSRERMLNSLGDSGSRHPHGLHTTQM